MVKKWMPVLLCFVLMFSFAGVGSAATVPQDCDSIQGQGELLFCSYSAKYESDNTLLVQGMFINVGSSVVTQVDKLNIKVNDKNGTLIADALWEKDPAMMQMNLHPGQTQLIDLPFDGALRGDVSTVDTSYEIDITLEQPPIQAKGSINIYVDGSQVKSEVAPFVQDGSTLVPLRAIFEAMGVKVAWDGPTQTVTATDDTNKLVLKIGEKQLTINGETVTFDVPAQIVDGSTFVPLRAVAESLNSYVFYGKFDDAVTITIKSKE